MTGLVTLELNAFIVVVSLMIIAITVAGFMVFANFLNREKERAKRFRERREAKGHSDEDSQDRPS